MLSLVPDSVVAKALTTGKLSLCPPSPLPLPLPPLPPPLGAPAAGGAGRGGGGRAAAAALPRGARGLAYAAAAVLKSARSLDLIRFFLPSHNHVIYVTLYMSRYIMYMSRCLHHVI